MSISTSKKVWKFLIQIQLTKSNPKTARGVKVPCLMPIRVNMNWFRQKRLGINLTYLVQLKYFSSGLVWFVIKWVQIKLFVINCFVIKWFYIKGFVIVCNQTISNQMISDQLILDQIISVQTCNSQSNYFQSVLKEWHLD